MVKNNMTLKLRVGIWTYQTNNSTWSKVNVGTVDEANALVDSILKNARQDNSLIKSVLDNGVGSSGQNSNLVWIDVGEVIGTKGETTLRIV